MLCLLVFKNFTPKEFENGFEKGCENMIFQRRDGAVFNSQKTASFFFLQNFSPFFNLSMAMADQGRGRAPRCSSPPVDHPTALPMVKIPETLDQFEHSASVHPLVHPKP